MLELTHRILGRESPKFKRLHLEGEMVRDNSYE